MGGEEGIGWGGGGGGQLGRMGCKLVLLSVLPKQNCYPEAETSALFYLVFTRQLPRELRLILAGDKILSYYLF